jgi:uncharacterized Rmd1/YagE family protein
MAGFVGPTASTFFARALLVGQKLDIRAWPKEETLSALPLVAPVSDGLVVLFRHGVAVFFGVPAEAEEHVLSRLAPLVDQPYRRSVVEELKIEVRARVAEGLNEGRLILEQATLEKLQIVADVLSKSVLLDYYETRIARDFDRIEPLAHELEENGRLHGGTASHMKRIGSLLLAEHRMVGRAEINEKPEVLWEHPELDRLYALLETEFEIRERTAALDRKIDLVARTMRTLVDLLDARHTLRVEWYIVALIVFEILLTLYRGH